eukprot:TRINITY_DN20415_c0_g1_i2.p1 TRINITY_DN20415_c0_g1~~TRINITY_DN20415_c0_g1_i2.p1  ORF type:complete len:181 (-),score=29.37 TRINITY_DN20415_c0_g1_i2:76-618(-)
MQTQSTPLSPGGACDLEEAASTAPSEESSEDCIEELPVCTELHPDDTLHQNWYETTVRLRGAYFIFFSLAVYLAVALGLTMELFFAVMAAPADCNCSTAVVFGILLIPIFLLVTSVFVDEILDIGLDSMDLPALGLVRATCTTSIRVWRPSFRVSTVEKCLVFAFEGIPILNLGVLQLHL